HTPPPVLPGSIGEIAERHHQFARAGLAQPVRADLLPSQVWMVGAHRFREIPGRGGGLAAARGAGGLLVVRRPGAPICRSRLPPDAFPPRGPEARERADAPVQPLDSAAAIGGELPADQSDETAA